MGKSVLLEAIVLRTVNIGEADRFCILFTRERGRLAARARGVRKPKSRMGGSVLPFRHLSVELSESSAGAYITSVSDRGDAVPPSASFSLFLRLEQGIELLLALTEDEEPLRDVFDLLLQFIVLAGDETSNPLPVFQLRLLHLLGFLPSSEDDTRYRLLSDESRAFVQACTKIQNVALLADLVPDGDDLSRFLRMVVDDQLQRPLKSAGM